MKFLYTLIFLTLFLGGAYAAQEKNKNTVGVDAYLLKAGWEKQSGGWMDPETGLVWGPETGKTSWGQAKASCQSLALGGKNSWRLPTVDELQRSVCKVSGYMTRVPCPQPRDHQKDIWLLNNEKGNTYWASDLIPGDPYNAFYFAFDVEGQQVITSKGDKSRFRCVTMGTTSKAVLVNAATAAPQTKIAEVTGPMNKEHSFYIAPFIGVGFFFTPETAIANSAYGNVEVRAGYKVAKDFMIQGSVDTGLNAQKFSYPVITTIALGGEYFIVPERFSAFIDFGMGILSTNNSLFAPGVTTVRQTSAAFAWRGGVTLATIKWGDNGQYNFPISAVYTGYKSSMMSCHTVLLSIGFMYFN